MKGNALMGASAKKPKKFIAGAIKHPGSLHAALGVPQGQNIPASKITAAARSGSKNLRQKAGLALTLEGLKK